MIEKTITNDLRAAYGADDFIVDHLIKHGPGWIALYHARGQFRVALYLDDGSEGAEFDLVVGEMDLESALAIMGLGEDERKN